MWLCKISLGDGRCGQIGVDLMHKRRSSKVFPEAVAVASHVFMVLTCLSVNPLDFGYRGDVVMWSSLWFNINLANVCEANGGPLSVVKLLGVPYCEKKLFELACDGFCCFFVEILKVKGYLLNVSTTNKYSLFLNVKKSAARSCQGASGTSLGIMGWICCVALCWMHILQHLTYLIMLASIPGQYSVALALCCIFSMPRCLLCNSFSDLS